MKEINAAGGLNGYEFYFDMKDDEADATKAANGYTAMSESAGRVSFNRGYTEHGFAEEVFHLHLRYAGDNEELLFRDYLTAHPQTAREYESLKVSLADKFRYDRDGYTEAKGGFIRSVMERAKREAGRK